MLTGKLIKLILIYLVVINTIAIILFLSEFIYSKSSPSAKGYRTFFLKAMAEEPRRFNNFKASDDYAKFMNATSADSIRFYYDRYTHTP